MDGWMDARMDARMDAWMDGWMLGWMDELRDGRTSLRALVSLCFPHVLFPCLACHSPIVHPVNSYLLLTFS